MFGLSPASSAKGVRHVQEGVCRQAAAKLHLRGARSCRGQRFVSVLDAQGVLDRETGLVWERSPSTVASDWFTAHDQCKRQKWGNRMGWRLPTIEELASLVDPSIPYPGPTLPRFNPFTGVQQWKCWSATTLEDRAGENWAAWGVDFDRGGVDYAGKINGDVFHWCVGRGQGVDPPVTR